MSPMRTDGQRVLSTLIVRTVAFCTRHVWLVIAAALVVGCGSAAYAAKHFAISSDISKLMSPDLPWRQRELAYQAAFPQQAEAILAVVEGPTPELTDAATRALTDRLTGQTSLFHSVRNEGDGEFFRRNALLYLPTDEVVSTAQKLGSAAPFVKVLATDPSLRGLAQALSIGLQGARMGRYGIDDMVRPLTMAADTLEQVLAGGKGTFSWHVLVSGAPPKSEDLRRLVTLWPVLDYHALEPGKASIAAVRDAVREAKLESDFMSTVRLTGPVPLEDQEFATLREGTWLNGLVTTVCVLTILWLALRSWRIVAAVIATILVGLATTAAIGLMLVGMLNPISVAFAVLFVGLGADFAIQFSVRYRAERHDNDDLRSALISAARRVGAPLTLAAAAAAAGFLSFQPTNYTGLAQLGLIAGCGMIVAYVLSLTLLPALLMAFKPPGEPKPLGYARLIVADHFLQRHRIAVVAGTSLLVLAALPLLLHLHFDFSPASLRVQSSEAVKTLDLLRKEGVVTNNAQVLVQPADVASVSKRLSALPEVARTRSLDDFVPTDQEHKLALIRHAASVLHPALSVRVAPAPSDAENVAALRRVATSLRDTAGDGGSPGPTAARRLAADLDKLADEDSDLRRKAEAAFVVPLRMGLDDLHLSLQPHSVTRSNLPAGLVRDWTTQDGRMRVEVEPKGNVDDGDTLRTFATAMLAAEPTATGTAVETYEWGRAIIIAFIQSAVFALCAIAILLWIVLRRVGDVLLTLIPLLVAAAATLQICAATGFALNYANIIALPVLLGIGVAFKIYYVMAWRGGVVDFLQSSLTRAVFFSALMTATAFGSLWLSKHPGTSSMGKLLALSLVCTLASAALFQPALMGPPRKGKSPPPRDPASAAG